MVDKLLIGMGSDCVLYYLGVDHGWHRIYANPKCKPYRFNGSECAIAECFPHYIVDAYYVDELPKSFSNCVRG